MSAAIGHQVVSCRCSPPPASEASGGEGRRATLILLFSPMNHELNFSLRRQILVAAVAQWPVAGALAGAEERAAGFIGGVLQRRERRPLVAAVATRLIC